MRVPLSGVVAFGSARAGGFMVCNVSATQWAGVVGGVQAARERGIVTVIDGAHALAQIELNMQEIGADFYAANCHKWMYVCSTCGCVFCCSSTPHQYRYI